METIAQFEAIKRKARVIFAVIYRNCVTVNDKAQVV